MRRDRPHARLGAQVLRGPGGDPRGRARAARGQRWLSAFGVETVRARPPGAGRRVQPAPARGRPAGHRRARGRFAQALALVRAGQPAAAVLDGPRGVRLRPVAGPGLRRGVRGGVRRAPTRAGTSRRPTSRSARRRAGRRAPAEERAARTLDGTADRARGARPGAPPATRPAEPTPGDPGPVAPSDEELLRSKRFDALEPGELAQLYRLMTRLEMAPPRGARGAPSATATASESTCAARCAAACGRPAIRSGSRAGAGGSCAGGWCCCATSRARWSPTPAPTSSS